MKLYVYDHCPYCVKAEAIFGIKDIKFDLIFLSNEDEKTPISMIGKKMLPILEYNGRYLPESLDIIRYVDNLYKPPNVKFYTDPEIEDWLGKINNILYKLTMPRWVESDLPEFQSKEAKKYFKRKKEKYIGSFELHLRNSKNLISEANHHLESLELILGNKNLLVNDKVFSINDFHLFATLRGISIVKGIKYPKKVNVYRNLMAKFTKINLHDNIAI